MVNYRRKSLDREKIYTRSFNSFHGTGKTGEEIKGLGEEALLTSVLWNQQKGSRRGGRLSVMLKTETTVTIVANNCFYNWDR